MGKIICKLLIVGSIFCLPTISCSKMPAPDNPISAPDKPNPVMMPAPDKPKPASDESDSLKNNKP